jgi:hypothetical protein
MLGIPCVYYGTEQAFDGSSDLHDAAIEPLEDNNIPFEDWYIREAMFGAKFGAFGTEGCHFLDRSDPTYMRIVAIARIRNREDAIGLALQRGRQYLREISLSGQAFTLPAAGKCIAWSRIVNEQEVLIVMNANGAQVGQASVTVHAEFRADLSTMAVLYRSDWTDAQLKAPPNEVVLVSHPPQGRATVNVTLPPAGMSIIA